MSLIINCVRHYSLSAENKRPQTPDPDDVDQLATAIRKEKKKIKNQKFSFIAFPVSDLLSSHPFS